MAPFERAAAPAGRPWPWPAMKRAHGARGAFSESWNLGYAQKYRRSTVILSQSTFFPRPALAMDDDLPPRITGVLLGRSTSCLREAVRSYLLFEEPENGMASWSLCAEISEARPGRRGRWLPRAAPTAP